MKTKSEVTTAFILSVIAVALMFFPALFQDARSIQWDALDLHYPHLAFFSRTIQSGTVPLWEPHLFCGYPFIGYLQSGAFYPLNLATALVKVVTPRIMILLTVISYLMAFSGLFLLSRHLGLSKTAATFAAVTWAFSGQLLGHATHLGIIQIYALFPWVLLITIRSWTSNKLRSIVPAGILLGWSILAGHFQSALYCFVFWISWITIGMASREGNAKSRVWHYLGIVIVGTVACMLATGIQLFSTAELALQSSRGSLSEALSRTESLNLRSLATMFAPDIYGGINGPYTGPWDRTNQQCYAGILTPFLWVAGIASGLCGFRRKKTLLHAPCTGSWPKFNIQGNRSIFLFLMSWIVFGFLFSLGDFSPFHDWVTGLLPGWDLVRTPAAILPLVFLALSLLAAIGLDWMTSLQPGMSSTLLRYAILALTFLQLIAVYRNSDLMFGRAPPYTHFQTTSHREFLDRQFTSEPGSFRVHEWDIREIMLTNEPSWKGWYGTSGRISGLHLRNLGHLLQLSQFKRDILDVIRAKYILVSEKGTATSVRSTGSIPSGATCWNPGKTLQMVAPGVLLNQEACSRVFPVNDWVVSHDDIDELLLKVDLHHTAILQKEADFPAVTSPINWSWTPTLTGIHRFEFGYSMDQRAILVIGDTWTPDWHGTIDGRPIQVVRVDHALQGISALAGTHSVKLWFLPFSYRLGAFFWALAACIAAACLVAPL